MKFSPVFVGFMSLVAGALAKKGVTPQAAAAPIDDGPVQLNFGLIQAFGRRDRCLAAIKSEAGTQIQLQLCDQNNVTQIWKFKPSTDTIQLAFPQDNNDVAQCLSAFADSDPKKPHHLTLAPCTEGMYEKRFSTTTSNGVEVGGGFKGYCIDVGTQVIVYKCKVPAETNQQWVVAGIEA